MSPDDIVDIFGLPEMTVRNALQRGELKCRKYEITTGFDNQYGDKFIYGASYDAVCKWIRDKSISSFRPIPMMTFLAEDEYDKFAIYCAKQGKKCHTVIRDLVCKELRSHGYKLQRYHPANKG